MGLLTHPFISFLLITLLFHTSVTSEVNNNIDTQIKEHIFKPKNSILPGKNVVDNIDVPNKHINESNSALQNKTNQNYYVSDNKVDKKTPKNSKSNNKNNNNNNSFIDINNYVYNNENFNNFQSNNYNHKNADKFDDKIDLDSESRRNNVNNNNDFVDKKNSFIEKNNIFIENNNNNNLEDKKNNNIADNNNNNNDNNNEKNNNFVYTNNDNSKKIVDDNNINNNNFEAHSNNNFGGNSNNNLGENSNNNFGGNGNNNLGENSNNNFGGNGNNNFGGNGNNNFGSNLNNNNNFAYNSFDKKRLPTPSPLVEGSVRKVVEFNYGVNYFALSASADSRFLIRYSPPFKVGTPWPLPKFYNSSQQVFAVDPDFEVVTHLPLSHQARSKRSNREAQEAHEDTEDLHKHLRDKDDAAELNFVPHSSKKASKKSSKKMDGVKEDFDQDCTVLRESIRRMKLITFGGRWDPEEGLVENDEDEDGLSGGSPRGDWEWNGGQDEIKKLLELARGVVIKRLDIYVVKPCQYYPHLDMNESYQLRVTPEGIVLRSREVWGVLRGLETINQLVYRLEGDSQLFFVNKTSIRDSPRFKHRGVMIDTSRHYLDLSTILENLESMAQNKFNVMHWHIVDDQSFPFQSTTFPNLSNFGAYNARTHIYTHEDIALVIEEARIRGIRVIPEFDTPGHTFSWGFGQEHLLTPCYNFYGVFKGLFGPINPILKKTYRFLQQFFKEVMTVFKDKYIHFGGDEVPFDCWLSNLQIKNFMLKNMIDDIKQVLSFYTRQLLQLIHINSKSLKRQTASIVWQEMFDNDIQLPMDTIIQVWSGDAYDLQRVVRAGYGVLFSSCWYLDYIQYGQDWDKYYTCEHIANLELSNESLFYGGEVCLWAEYTDDANFLTRLWPRASAAAERLWSEKHVTNVFDAAPRLEEHRCRMMNRGLQVGVLSGPSHCPRFRKKYKYSRHANSKRHVVEVEQKKEDANSAREHSRKAKRRSKASSNFSFDFVDDADSSEKGKTALRSIFVYMMASLMVGVLFLVLLKKFLKIPMRSYQVLVMLIIVVVVVFIALQPSNTSHLHPRHHVV